MSIIELSADAADLHLSNRSHLGCQICSLLYQLSSAGRQARAHHQIDIICQDLPGSLNIRDQGLTTQFALSSDFKRYTGDFSGEYSKLSHHVIDRDLQVEDLSLHIGSDSFRQVSSGYRFCLPLSACSKVLVTTYDFGNLSHLICQVTSHFL